MSRAPADKSKVDEGFYAVVRADSMPDPGEGMWKLAEQTVSIYRTYDVAAAVAGGAAITLPPGSAYFILLATAIATPLEPKPVSRKAPQEEEW
jgi:hypothetical protein